MSGRQVDYAAPHSNLPVHPSGRRGTAVRTSLLSPNVPAAAIRRTSNTTASQPATSTTGAVSDLASRLANMERMMADLSRATTLQGVIATSPTTRAGAARLTADSRLKEPMTPAKARAAMLAPSGMSPGTALNINSMVNSVKDLVQHTTDQQAKRGTLPGVLKAVENSLADLATAGASSVRMEAEIAASAKAAQFLRSMGVNAASLFALTSPLGSACQGYTKVLMNKSLSPAAMELATFELLENLTEFLSKFASFMLEECYTRRRSLLQSNPHEILAPTAVMSRGGTVLQACGALEQELMIQKMLAANAPTSTPTTNRIALRKPGEALSMDDVTCFHCAKVGHYATVCPNRKERKRSRSPAKSRSPKRSSPRRSSGRDRSRSRSPRKGATSSRHSASSGSNRKVH